MLEHSTTKENNHGLSEEHLGVQYQSFSNEKGKRNTPSYETENCDDNDTILREDTAIRVFKVTCI